MKIIGFLIESMHLLKYWIPFIIELNKFDVKSIIYMEKKGKKTSNDNQNPLLHKNFLKELSNKYNFELKYKNEIDNEISVLITTEGSAVKKKNFKWIIFQYCTNCFYHAHNSIDNVDYYVFESNKNTILNNHYKQKYTSFLNSMKKNEHKTKFLGSPKFFYDNFNKQDILTKYNLNKNEKYIFFFLPVAKNLNLKYNDIPSRFYNQINQIMDYFISKQYKIILKTRNKTSYKNTKIYNKKHTYYFEDISFFPSISLELIYVSDFIMNFNSSGSIEGLYYEKPILNYEYSKNHRHIYFNDILIENCKSFINFNDLSKLDENFNKIISQDNKTIIKEFNKKYFIENSKKKLIEFIIEQTNT